MQYNTIETTKRSNYYAFLCDIITPSLAPRRTQHESWCLTGYPAISKCKLNQHSIRQYPIKRQTYLDNTNRFSFEINALRKWKNTYQYFLTQTDYHKVFIVSNVGKDRLDEFLYRVDLPQSFSTVTLCILTANWVLDQEGICWNARDGTERVRARWFTSEITWQDKD